MRNLSELPAEIILLIAESLDSQSTINALAQTNSALYSRLNPFLYRHHVQHQGVPTPALTWAVQHEQPGTLQKLLKAGADLFSAPFWYSEGRPTLLNPIYYAAASGHAGIVKILLDAGMGERLAIMDCLILSIFITLPYLVEELAEE